MKRSLVLALVLLALARTAMFAGGGGQKTAGGAEKIELVLMVETADNALFTDKIVPMIRAKFPEVNFVSKFRDPTQQEKTVKAAFAVGESIDIQCYWPTEMQNFIPEGIPLDLTPYFNADPAWKNSYGDNLKVGEYNGKILAVPYGTVYPMMLINKDLAAKAGIAIKDQWTWKEFLDVCTKIKSSLPTDVFPIGCNGEWQCWFTRNGFQQIWNNEAELDAFCRGGMPFTDPKVKQVFDNIKYLFDQNYMYPGDGALTATNDQVISAFVRQKIVMMPYVNSIVSQFKKDTLNNAFDIGILTWPNMGTPDMNKLIINSDGYFIMSNTKHPDKAVEVLKYMTSREVMQVLADAGTVVPIAISSSDPDYAQYGRDLPLAYPNEVSKTSPEIFDYILYHTPANYILYGQQSLNELEALRQKIKK
jgi:ABC-type glycerol-3-phosphate transport system substrate-binding protein